MAKCSIVDHSGWDTYFESRMTQFCARRPSMTDSSLTFRVLTYMSSMEPVSFCRETKTHIQINFVLFICKADPSHICLTSLSRWETTRSLPSVNLEQIWRKRWLEKKKNPVVVVWSLLQTQKVDLQPNTSAGLGSTSLTCFCFSLTGRISSQRPWCTSH